MGKPGPAGQEGTRKTKRPESEGSKGGAQQTGPRLNGTLALSGGGRCVGEEGTGTEPESCSRGCRRAEPAAGAWCGSVQWGRGGAWEQGFLSQGKAAPRRLRSRRHCGVVTAPPPRTPGRCPPLPPSASWVCPLISSRELRWLSVSWPHPYSCFPLVGPEVSSELALHWAPSAKTLEAAFEAYLSLASQSHPFPAWRPGAGWTLSWTRSFFSMYGAAQSESGCEAGRQSSSHTGVATAPTHTTLAILPGWPQ